MPRHKKIVDPIAEAFASTKKKAKSNRPPTEKQLAARAAFAEASRNRAMTRAANRKLQDNIEPPETVEEAVKQATSIKRKRRVGPATEKQKAARAAFAERARAASGRYKEAKISGKKLSWTDAIRGKD